MDFSCIHIICGSRLNLAFHFPLFVEHEESDRKENEEIKEIGEGPSRY